MSEVVNEAIVHKEEEFMISPYEYFKTVKGKIQEMNDDKLTQVYDNAMHLAEQYKKTGQKKGLRKLLFHLESIIKEKKVLDAGITKFVYKSDIEDYIENVASKQVVILDIASYEREIPEDIVEAMTQVKDLFDEFYVVCTDYSGKMSKQVQKDPILFGVFLDRNKNAINERFYYIGDWVDEHCDLTLDKLVGELSLSRHKSESDILHNNLSLTVPDSLDDLRNQLSSLHLDEKDLKDGTVQLTLISNEPEEKKPHFFEKVKSFLKGTKNDKR